MPGSTLPILPLTFLTAIFYLNFVSRIILGPFLPVIEQELSLGHGGAGSLFLFIQIGYAAGLLGSGVVSWRFSHRHTIVASAVAVGISLAGLSLASSLWAMRVWLVLVGTGAGLYLPAGVATITHLVKDAHWGKALAFHELAPNLAFITAPFLADAFLASISWRGVLAVLGGAAILLGGCFTLSGHGGSRQGEAPRLQTVAGLLRDPAVWAMMLIFAAGVGSSLGLYSMLPLFLVAFRMSEDRPKFHRFIYISGAISLVLVILVRVLLVVNFLPDPYKKMVRLDVYGWDDFMDKVSNLAGDRPVVFIGSYQNPSRYICHTGKEAFAFNDVSYRSNQFDLENIERKIQGKEALLIFPKKSIEADDFLKYRIGYSDSIQYPNGKFRYYVFKENYHTYNFIPVDILLDNITVKAGSTVDIPVRMRNPWDSPVKFSEGDTIGTFLTSYLIQYGKPVDYQRFENISSLVLEDEYRTSFKFHSPDKPGIYYLRVSVKSGWLPPGINGRLKKVRVE